MKPPQGWDNQKNVGQFVWDVVNPNPDRWKEGVRLMHHLLTLHKDDPEKRERAMLTLCHMYHDLLEDYARAAFWYRAVGVEKDPEEYARSVVILAECYWRLGYRDEALKLLAKVPPNLSHAKLLGDMGETDRALKMSLAEADDDSQGYAALAAVVPNVWRVTTRPRFATDPFQLGVASGDPTPTGGVLWTRLAPRPFEPDGGMEGLRAVVSWEVANDAQFTKIVQKGRATAAPELSFSVHVDVDGLEPDRWYFYRFMAGEAVSTVGRFRTAPAAGAKTPLAFAFASCQRWDQGLFTAYAHFAQEEIDLAVHLGDYIYEGASPATALRTHYGLEIRTLDDYRRRYAQYKSDAHLQAAHARCPWPATGCSTRWPSAPPTAPSRSPVTFPPTG